MGFDLDVGVKPQCDFLRNLVFVVSSLARPVQRIAWMVSYQSLWLLYVFLPEEKLTVQIAQIDRIEVDDGHFSEASKNKVL